MKFGRLSVISRGTDMIQGSRRKVRWICRCDCGSKGLFDASNLRTGNTASCGCLQIELQTAKVYRHGHAKRFDGRQSPEYMVWSNMRRRCYDPKNAAFKNYGGRGITVCPEWKEDFAVFIADMGERPKDTTLDRIDNNGNYEPGNCRWATHLQQARNSRKNRRIVAFGHVKTLSEWAEITGMKRESIAERLNAGKSPEFVFRDYVSK